MLDQTQLRHQISDGTFQTMIIQYSAQFSEAEIQLLNQIIHQFQFDGLQAQALAQAVLQQSRFDPNAQHISMDEDDETTSICPHCLNPPIPPLRDYMIWREKTVA